MLKHVAIIQATNREMLGRWHAGATHRNYKSPICKDAKDAEKWLEENLQKYPEDEYFEEHAIIAFDEEASRNAEKMFELLMNVF